MLQVAESRENVLKNSLVNSLVPAGGEQVLDPVNV